ncbi:MAG: HEAT repeat domain-containing protein [Candidatus Riflebacteria bacterium]|nr:HEAT repeat domain-containing protein [Candidatus Riflebacteria bacterium]
MIKERLETWLNVRSGEWGDIFFFWFLNALLWTGLAVGESVSEALFLKRVGAASLPMMFIICALFAIPLSLVFARIQARIQPLHLAVGLCLGSALSIWGCGQLVQSSILLFGIPIGSPMLYILQVSLATLLSTHFSILLSGHYNTLDAKRLFPLILSGVVVGAMWGGVILNSFAVMLGTQSLLNLWATLLLISTSWLLIFNKKLSSISYVSDEPALPKFVGSGWLERLVHEGRAALDSRMLVLLALSMLIMTVTRYFIEFQYSDIFSRAFPDEEQLARFFGTYTVVSNLTALLIQSLITGRMIQILGVSNANLFYPCSTLMAFTGLAAYYWVPTGIFARFNQEGFRRAVFQPVSNLFYNAVPAKRRAHSIAFNEGIVVPLGAVIAGLVLMWLRTRPFALALLAMALSAFWLILTWLQRGVYSQSLLEMLKSSQIGELSGEGKELGMLDTQTQLLVIDALKDPQDEVVEVAAELLLMCGRPTARLALVRQAATSRSTVQIILLKKLARIPAADTRAFLLKSMESPEESVKLAAVEALTFYPHDDEIRHRIAEFLEYPDARFQAAASAAMVRAGDLVTMMKALIILQRLLFSRNTEEVILGIKTLGETRDERFWVNLRIYLKSETPSLRLAAMRSMYSMVQAGEIQEHLDILQNLLHDKIREIRSLSIQILSRVRSERSMSLLIEALSDMSPRNRKWALEALAGYGHESIPELLMVLDDPKSSTFAQEGAVRLLSLSQTTSIRERLARFAHERIRALYELKLDEYCIRSELEPADGEFLATVLNEKAGTLLRLILGLVAPDRSGYATRTVFKNLYSANQEMMSNAIEVLQSIGERTLIYHILPVLEGLPLEQIVAYGRRVFALEERRVRMVLGRHLLSLDKDLREAAIYTIGRIGLTELHQAVRKIGEGEGIGREARELCAWTLEHLGHGSSVPVSEGSRA